jgi:hypothetical protein
MQFNHISPVPDLPVLETIENENGRFYIAPDGQKLPSITTVLGYFKTKELQAWKDRVGPEEAERIKNWAGTRGNKFHKLVEMQLRNQAWWKEDISLPMQQSLSDFEPALRRIMNIQHIEARLYSTTLGIAGRCDLIADFDSEFSTIDHKSSMWDKKEENITNYFEQVTGYGMMYEGMTGVPVKQGVVLISSDADNVPHVYKVDLDTYKDSLRQKIETYKKENPHVF